MKRGSWNTPKNKNMTIRRRLDVASVLMIVITIITTLACCIGCISVTMAWTRRTQTLSVMNNDDVLMTCREITRQITDAISEADGSTNTKKFTELENRLSDDSICVVIYKNSEKYHSFGAVTALDSNLQNAADEIGESGYISSGNRQLYVRDVSAADENYRIYIFISKVSNPYREVTIIMLVAVIAVAVVFLIAFLFAKKFLSRFVFAKIIYPLETLETGVHEIQGGNLSYRISYDGEDEFRPICDSFNEMSNQLQISADTLKRQEQNRKVLFASISHDLRSPLTTISAYAGGLLDGIAEDQQTKERYLHQINAKVSEMIRMVNRLFMFSKMDMDEYPTYPIALELGQEISAFVDAVRQEYAEKGLYISVSQMDLCPVMADPKQLHTIFANIIENSLRYKHQPVGMLSIGVRTEGDRCIMTFRDNGPGVAEEDLHRIFDVFFRSDPARKNSGSGSGLGLAIVANAVKRANGTVTAANAPSRGLEITIVLPKGASHAENTDH